MYQNRATYSVNVVRQVKTILNVSLRYAVGHKLIAVDPAESVSLPKAVSKLMGYAKELITMDVYGDNKNSIPEKISELTSYIDDVLPKKMDKVNMKSEVLDTVMEVEQYLQQIDAEGYSSCLSQREVFFVEKPEYCSAKMY